MSILYSKEADGTLNVLVFGKVSRDAEVKSGQNGSRVKFSVCYGKSKFMDCEAWADSDVGGIAACLEKGDLIGVSGVHRSWEYKDKKYSSLTADMIFTPAVLEAMPEPEDLPPSTSTYKDIEDALEDEDDDYPL